MTFRASIPENRLETSEITNVSVNGYENFEFADRSAYGFFNLIDQKVKNGLLNRIMYILLKRKNAYVMISCFLGKSNRFLLI